MIVALAGGVGAARMLRGLVAVADPATITAVVNTGDDTVMHGLHISPDLDTVTYTLAGAINPETGWGLAGETWSAMEHLRAYGGGRLGWFNLGDRDLGTHLYRTSRLAEGARLSEVTTEIAARWGVGLRLLPMSDDRVETRVILAGDREVGFQDYFVGLRHGVPVRAVRLAGAETAKAAPGVLEALAGAEAVVICPSNPIVSIGPVLATGGIGEVVASRRDAVVAVSPIVAGKALKGPADRMLSELGHEPSAVGVARLWAPYASTLVIDEADASLAPSVEAAGMRAVVTRTVMTNPGRSATLARTVLSVPRGQR
ncbi:MAG: 2-phospho-L-lactate transferase [Acidimicrobiales bacterium]